MEEMYCKQGHKMRPVATVPDAELKKATCRGCAGSSSESGEALFYTCSDCQSAEWAMIHRKCAELPKQIDHPMHSRHPLVLLTKPPYQNEACKCEACKKSWRNFVYHCCVCDFDVDILCAFSEEDIVIPTHHHPVRLMRRPASFICNACDAECDKEESYICTKPSCRFWIHKRCGSLPEMFKHPDHNHQLVVDVSVPVRYRRYKLSCEMCHEDLRSSDWVYYCWRCKYFIHFKCIRGRSSIGWKDGLGHRYPPRLEMIRDLKTVVFQSSRGPYGISEYPIYWKEKDLKLGEVKVDSHKHSLVLIESDQLHEQEIICDGCIQPIDHASSPHYKCGQHCGFFLHTTCVVLPQEVETSWHHHYLPFVLPQEDEAYWDHHHLTNIFYENDNYSIKLHFPENPWEVVKCKACDSFCNGYGYKCSDRYCDFYLDIKCYFMTGFIAHIGHIHQLSEVQDTEMFVYQGGSKFRCGACGEVSKKVPYMECEPCKFRLGYECATLPATVKHRWDKHPLVLSFPPFFREVDQDDDFFCQVCEEEIHPRHWAYRCAECDQSFHPRCIPTLGESRNIKFGAIITVKSHPHPLTFVPQAKLSGLCHNCRKSVYWSRSFECVPCGFYICHDCITSEEPVMESLPGSSTIATESTK